MQTAKKSSSQTIRSNGTLAPAQYKILLNQVRGYYKETALTGTQALSRSRLNAYWYIGKNLSSIETKTASVLAQLADDLDTSYALLQRTRQFYEIWPRGLSPEAKQITWSHHIELLPIHNLKIREFYIKQTLKHGWGQNALHKAITANLYETKIELPTESPDFKIPLYVYMAEPLTIIDGDTLDARLDLGFETWTQKRFRLKGLNCAEMNDGGLAAKEFVIKKLAGIKRILVQTHKADIYGRYLVTIYYHPTLTAKADIIKNGFCLNRELLQAKLAMPMLV